MRLQEIIHSAALRGFALIEVLIVVAIISPLAAWTGSNVLRSRVTANEALAQATLKTISTACETYSVSNGGNFPGSETDLTSSTLGAPYLNRPYNGRTISGYDYNCTFDLSQYTCTAQPHSAGKTGTSNYTITTGGILSAENAI